MAVISPPPERSIDTAPAPSGPAPDESLARRIDRLVDAQEREFLDRMPQSRALLDEARSVLAGGVTSSWQSAPPQAVWLADGKGAYVTDVDGNVYVDLHGGFGAMVVGHAHPAVVRAVQDRVTRGTHFAQPTEDLIVVARELRRRFGLARWRFCNSGTEATMEAIHLVRCATRRSRIIKVEGSYHGHHDNVMVSVYPDAAVCGPASRPRTVREHDGVPIEVARLISAVPFGDLDAVERVLVDYPGEVAGMIIEPVMMNIGIIEPPDGYLAALRTLLHAHGAYLIFDEVKTGLAIAPGGATELSGVVPDVVCLAKVLGGGLPCGALGGTAEIMQVIEDGRYEQVGTFNGNPLTMAAARATLLEVLTPDAYVHLDGLRDAMVRGVQASLARHHVAGYVTALGAKGCVIFSDEGLRNYRDFLRYDDHVGHLHWLYQHNGGVFLPPWGKGEQWTLSVQHTTTEVDRYVANLDRFAAALAGAVR